MTTTTKAHTPGSERAARALIELSETTIFSQGTTVRIAEIIDRETAAPEMLEALELAQTYLRNQQPKWAQAEDLPPIMHELSAAIQKARGGQ